MSLAALPFSVLGEKRVKSGGKRSRSGGILRKSAPSWGVWGVLRWFLGRKGAWVVKKYEYFQAQRWGKIGSLSAGENPPALRRRSPWKKLKKMGKSAQGGLGAAPLLGSGVEKFKKILNFKIKMRFSALAKVGATPRLKITLEM